MLLCTAVLAYLILFVLRRSYTTVGKRRNLIEKFAVKWVSQGHKKIHFSSLSIKLASFSSLSSSSFEGYPLQVRHKQDWGRGFILLLPQTVALLGSDAGSDVIKPASSFVIQNRQTSCSMWCPMYRTRC